MGANNGETKRNTQDPDSKTLAQPAIILHEYGKRTSFTWLQKGYPGSKTSYNLLQLDLNINSKNKDLCVLLYQFQQIKTLLYIYQNLMKKNVVNQS